MGKHEFAAGVLAVCCAGILAAGACMAIAWMMGDLALVVALVGAVGIAVGIAVGLVRGRIARKMEIRRAIRSGKILAGKGAR